METLTRFPSYTRDELDAFERGLLRDCAFGYGRFYHASDWKEMAQLAEGGLKYCDNKYGEHDAKREVAARVYREMERRVRDGQRDGDEPVRKPTQNSGATSTRSADRKGMASEKQMSFLDDLLTGRDDAIARSARHRIDSVKGHVNSDTASQLIDSLMEAAPGIVAYKERMTKGQRDYLVGMWVERGVPENTAKVVLAKVRHRTTKDQASAMIDRAKAAARSEKTPDPKKIAAKVAEITDGYYEMDGDIIKVQWNRAGTHMYAKRLRKDDVHAGFQMESGLVRRMQGASALTRETAAQYGPLYGRCLNPKCSRLLTDEESIARGFGPECWGKMGW